ncbi:hypothetical protein [Arcobacter cloacae]|uniref:Uncharacterized protein n=1 Tax=Arcobacter cloacae TaxID=1054034 RepID=A0A6M8NSB3_9BACT|nr:hypothetical protein [Arcobacter cloacae]QKF90684.1 hypothetical protein ACLO_2227 [Arcobacter cloacae]RXI41466.1 hypothetical protein CP963_06770 [Arcobacter cloacae]
MANNENEESKTPNKETSDEQEGQVNIKLDNDSTIKDDDFEKNKEEFIKKTKKNPLKKILLILVAFLVSLLLIGVILYFTGFFEQKTQEPINTETNPQMTAQEQPVVEEYKFDLKDINSKKLNDQLAALTNKNLNEEKQEELEKIENEKRLIDEEKKREEEALKIHEENLLKEQEALKEKKAELEKEKAELELLREEALKIKAELQVNQNSSVDSNIEIENDKAETKDEKDEIENTDKIETPNSNQSQNNGFLKFINVAKIKGVLYKKYLDSVVAINPNVILCRDDKNRIELYYGPFNSDNERTELLNRLIDNGFEQAYELEFTKEEFDNRCNY